MREWPAKRKIWNSIRWMKPNATAVAMSLPSYKHRIYCCVYVKYTHNAQRTHIFHINVIQSGKFGSYFFISVQIVHRKCIARIFSRFHPIGFRIFCCCCVCFHFFIFILKFHIHMCGVCLMKVIFDTFTQTDNLILVLFLMNELWYPRTAMDFPNGHLFELFGFSESDTVAANNVNTNFINVFLLCTFRFEWIGLLWNVGGSQHEIGVRHVAPSLTMSGQRGKLLRVWCTIRRALSYNLSECSGFDLNDLRIFCCLHLLPNDLYFHNATFENGMILWRFFAQQPLFGQLGNLNVQRTWIIHIKRGESQ